METTARHTNIGSETKGTQREIDKETITDDQPTNNNTTRIISTQTGESRNRHRTTRGDSKDNSTTENANQRQPTNNTGPHNMNQHQNGILSPSPWD